MAKTSTAPWDDCKVAFSIHNPDPFDDTGPNGVWHAPLPKGWELNEIDGTGARYVAVFRVAGLPSATDGKTVKDWLKKVGAQRR